jgi:hypothetical protein
MSQMETHIGKLRKVIIMDNHSVEDWCREKCEEAGVPSMLPEYYNSWKETLQYHLDAYNKYFFMDGEVWEAFEHKELEDDDIYEMSKNEDGTLSFTMRFYNGGTCLTECIEESIERINKTI